MTVNGMTINIHERPLPGASLDDAGALIDTLPDGAETRLWPSPRWPEMTLERGLAVGSSGGHGPVLYHVSDYEPRRRAVFSFDRRIFNGHHWFETTTIDGKTVLRHVFFGRPAGRMRLLWPTAFRWMHDALVEDALDRAEAALDGRPWQPRPFSPWVRFCRWALL
jgi:hypothetical protein